MRDSNADYYATRLNAEWQAIKASADSRARVAHEILAEHYADRLVEALRDKPLFKN